MKLKILLLIPLLYFGENSYSCCLCSCFRRRADRFHFSNIPLKFNLYNTETRKAILVGTPTDNTAFEYDAVTVEAHADLSDKSKRLVRCVDNSNQDEHIKGIVTVTQSLFRSDFCKK